MRSKWLDLFDDLPATEGKATLAAKLPRLRGGGVARTNPMTLKDCQVELDKAVQRISSLEREVQKQQGELRKLRPIAKADAIRRKKASQAGKMGGRGNAKW